MIVHGLTIGLSRISHSLTTIVQFDHDMVLMIWLSLIVTLLVFTITALYDRCLI